MPDPGYVQTPGLMALVNALQRIGYDPRAGMLGSVTVDTGRTSPLTVPLEPGAPGLILKGSEPLSAEDAAHEGAHVNMGAAGSALGTLAGKVLGVGGAAGYMQPDEAAAYLSQPNSATTDTDLKTLSSLGKTGPGIKAYRDLITALAQTRLNRAQYAW